MRNKLLAAAAFAALAVIPSLAAAEDPVAGAVGGAAAGAVTGGAIGGPAGAAAGAAVGGTVGAAGAAQEERRHQDRVIIEDRAPSVSEKTCVETPNRKDCVETQR
jgi:outer membrane lipoprotein SlyB